MQRLLEYAVELLLEESGSSNNWSEKLLQLTGSLKNMVYEKGRMRSKFYLREVLCYESLLIQDNVLINHEFGFLIFAGGLQILEMSTRRNVWNL